MVNNVTIDLLVTFHVASIVVLVFAKRILLSCYPHYTAVSYATAVRAQERACRFQRFPATAISARFELTQSGVSSRAISSRLEPLAFRLNNRTPETFECLQEISIIELEIAVPPLLALHKPTKALQ
jgi:hypothetical protein